MIVQSPPPLLPPSSIGGFLGGGLGLPPGIGLQYSHMCLALPEVKEPEVFSTKHQMAFEWFGSGFLQKFESKPACG